MTGRERIDAMLSGGRPDRLPSMPIGMMFAADRIGARRCDFLVAPPGRRAMTGRERIDAMLSGGRPDRLPLMPIGMMFAADRIGARRRDFLVPPGWREKEPAR
jgi:hypothetical protein